MKRQIIVMLLSSLLIQAVSLASNPANAPTISIDEATAPLRIRQAKEIFGRRSSKADLVRSTTTRANLSQFIVAELQRQLPYEYQAQAEEIGATLLSSSALNSLDPLLVLSVIKQESKFHPDALGRHGEVGLMQIKPETARWIAGRAGIPWHEESTLFDPQLNIRVGAAYVNFLRESFNFRGQQYLAAYNVGPAALRSRLRNNDVPMDYASSLTQHYANFYRTWLRFDTKLVAKLD